MGAIGIRDDSARAVDPRNARDVGHPRWLEFLRPSSLRFLPGGPMRRLLLLVFLIFLSVLVSADSKIKTRNTTMGHSSESTVYIRGARERTEGATMGPGASLVTIMQCDQKRIITVNPQTNACMVTSL